MARPRTIPDSDILAAAARVIGEVGPSRLTLALVAESCGLSAPTLVQRFGSKRALLLRLAQSAVSDLASAVAHALRATDSPLAAARRLLMAMAGMATTPQEMAHHLDFLQMDLTDPDFHRQARAHALAQERQLSGLFARAMQAGELRDGDATALARLCLTVTNGSLIRWAIVRRGTATAWLATDLEAVLAPWCVASPSRHAAPARTRVRRKK